MADNQLTTSSLPFRNFFINSYILPGFLFLVATILICSIFKEQLGKWTFFYQIDFNDDSTIETIKILLTTKLSLVTQILILFIVIFISIIAGNALSVFGGLLFDLTWFRKGIGWPYERILSYYPKNYIGKAIIITLFTTTNIICLIQIFKPFPYFGKFCLILVFIFLLKFIPKWYFSLIYGSDKKLRELPIYMLKNIPETLLKTNLFDEANRKLKAFLRERTKNNRNTLFETKWLLWKFLNKSRKYNWFKTTFIWLFSLSFVLDISIYITIFFGRFFGISHGITKYGRKAFKKKIKKISPENKIKNNTGIYWNTYISMINKNPENVRIANSHLKRAILIRNIATVGVIILFFLFNLQPENLKSDNFKRWQSWSFVWWLSSYLLFVGYNIIIYKYYTKYLVRCFILEDSQDE